MKNLILIFIFLFSFDCWSQQNPVLVIDSSTPIWHNPASYGTWNQLSLNVIGQLANQNTYSNPTTFFLNSEYKFIYKKSNVMSGVGFNFYKYNYNYYRISDFSICYNFQFKIRQSILSFGISPGVQQINFRIFNPTSISNINLPIAAAGTIFKMGAGLFFYHRAFYIGISSRNIIVSQFEKPFKDIHENFGVNAGYRYVFTRNFGILPTFSLFLEDGFLTHSTSILFQFKRIGLDAGLGYGNRNALRVLLGFTWRKFSAMYALHYQPTKLTNSISMLHEFKLTYRWQLTTRCINCSSLW